MRLFPALECRRASGADDDVVDQWVAEVDEARPQAVERLPDGVRLFFATTADRDLAKRLLVDAWSDLTCVSVEVSDEDWAARSQALLSPVEAGPFRILAPWHEAGSEASSSITLVIRPSMGFGTGHHASTRLCLRLLADQPVSGARVLDVGTGSGILALAAWRLNAASVLAIDPDSDALAAAADNAELNAAGQAVAFAHLDLAALADGRAGPFDLILANLTGATLIRGAELLHRLAASRATLIASGILEAEADDVTHALGAQRWSVAGTAQEDEWVGLCLTTRGSSPSESTAR